MPARRLASLLAVLGLWLALLLATQAQAADPLQGKWKYPDNTVLEFASGGVLNLPPNAAGEAERWLYWVEDDSTLVLVREEETMTMSFSVSKDGKRLTLYSEDRPGPAPQVLERVR